MDGSAEAYWLPNGIMARWSHGSASQGGIGLWLKKSFVAQFHVFKWRELEAGRVGVMSLVGTKGASTFFAFTLTPIPTSTVKTPSRSFVTMSKIRTGFSRLLREISISSKISTTDGVWGPRISQATITIMP
jgi:hypothetical protein